ncbi:MAG: hypothetical protein ACK4UJ_01640 [Leptonema sp. (in: bacteria)]
MFWDYIESLIVSNSQRRIPINKPSRVTKTSSKNKKIIFKDLSDPIQEHSKDALTNNQRDLENFREMIKDLQDPISGEPIHLENQKELYRCQTCSVIYLKDSFEFLLQYNHRKCVSCGKTTIVAFYLENQSIQIRRFDPENVTLENYFYFVNQSVKFRGTIVKILESRRGDYALMFEDKPWIEGFKIVVFYPLMKPKNGLERSFLKSLVGKEVKVRGILQKHEIFGYEILIFKRNMILDIQTH